MQCFGDVWNFKQYSFRSENKKLEGSLEGIPMLVLIYCRVSHNFISSLHITLGLDLNFSKKLGVRLGDGHRLMPKESVPV